MRSYYLDDMDIKSGDFVICKVDLISETITDGKVYKVKSRKVSGMYVKCIKDDLGQWTVPSSRFKKAG